MRDFDFKHISGLIVCKHFNLVNPVRRSIGVVQNQLFTKESLKDITYMPLST